MDPSTELGLQEIRDLPINMVHRAYEMLVPSERRLPDRFWAQYDEAKRSIGLRACLLLWVLSNFEDLPQEYQIVATIAIMSGQNSLVDVGTEAGKSMCMILPCLLSPGGITIIFSPSKRLQSTQVLSFSRYNIKAIVINEDTPNDPDLWKDICNGKYSVLLVQPEQLYMTNGRLPRLARLVTKDLAEDLGFLKHIQRLHVDEAHFVYTAGFEHYGLPAYRPAWGRLGEFRIKIGKQVPTQAFSGTQPPHIKAAIITNLLLDKLSLCSIELTSNRSNTVYATHPIVGELWDFRNLDFVVPVPYPTGWQLPKTLIFHDSDEQAGQASLYLTRRLPDDLQKKDQLIMHYHGSMSKEYLTQVYEDFSKAEGHCRVLHVTGCASTALDIAGIEVVIQYGITQDVTTALQRGSQGGRGSTGEAIFLVMYEPWVKTIDLAAIGVETASDPDRPNVLELTTHSTKQARTGVAMVKIIQQTEECLRKLFATYLNDRAHDALHFTTKWCCDRHTGTDFHLRDFFKGRLLYQDPDTSELYYGDADESDRENILPPERKKRKAEGKVRPTRERGPLRARLVAWLFQTHNNDPLGAVRPPSSILHKTDIAKLSRLHPTEITGCERVASVLGQTEEWKNEWSEKIYGVIQAYDQELEDVRTRGRAANALEASKLLT